MKKFTAGVMCGVILFFSVSAYAGNVTSVSLSSSVVQFHIGNTVKAISSQNTPILNYNSRAYIPLRSFAETTGATVNFQIASASTHYMNQIDIYTNKDLPQIDPATAIQDPEGIVTLMNLQYEPIGENNGDFELIGGKIKINKPINGKAINVFSDANGPHMEGFSPIYILNEALDPIDAGEIRPFTVPHRQIVFKNPEFRVEVNDIMQPIHIQRGSNIPSFPLFFEAGMLNEASDSLHRVNRPVFFQCYVVNLGDDSDLMPVPVKFQVYSEQNPTTPVYTANLPEFRGICIKSSGLQQIFLWDKRDLHGQFVKPGKYHYKFTLPQRSLYKTIGGSEILSCEIKTPLGGGENTFDIQ